MKVGDYVRTDNGYVGKIIEIEYITPVNAENRYIYRLDMDTLQWFEESNFIKSSPNIIDLIEVGDYVNGMRVSEILKRGRKIKYIRFMADSDYECYTELKEEEIETILTKEQFENCMYKVGE